MHARLSARTLYLRYFSPVSTVSEQKIAIFTDVDHDSRVGLVAELGGLMIAAGTYHRDPVGDTDAAEVALLVEEFAAGPRARVDPAGAPGRGRPGTGDPPLHRRGARPEHHDAPGVHRCRLHRPPGVRL